MAAGNRLLPSDILDSEFVDATELASSGTTSFLTLPIISTTAGTQEVSVDVSSLSGGIITDRETPLESGDIFLLSGAAPGSVDGYYTVDIIIDESTFSVLESIGTSTGGSAEFFHSPGGLRVGFDSTGLVNTTADNVQDALVDIDTAVTGNITPEEHAALRQLIHLADGTGGPWEEFVSGAFREILPIANPFPATITWYESSSKIKKIVKKTITRNPNKTPSIIEWKVYDTNGSTVLATVTDIITYTGIFETDRTRIIS
jgi:hypothetical protein